MEIEKKFKNVQIKYGDIILYSAHDALNVIEECKRLTKNILGIDAFKLYDNNSKIQPFMEYSIDFSSNNLCMGYWAEATEFIMKQTDKDLVFEIVYDGY